MRRERIMLDDRWEDEEDREEGTGAIYCEVCDRLTNHYTDIHTEGE
jgi:hypothetical protein